MATKQTIPAYKATPGKWYKNDRGTRILIVGTIDGSTEIMAQNEHRRNFPLAATYPLIPIEDRDPGAVAPEALRGHPIEGLVGKLEQLTDDGLDELEDIDLRPAVHKMIDAERRRRGNSAPTPTAICPVCGQSVALAERKGSTILVAHMGLDGAYCQGSGQSPNPQPELPTIEPAGRLGQLLRVCMHSPQSYALQVIQLAEQPVVRQLLQRPEAEGFPAPLIEALNRRASEVHPEQLELGAKVGPDDPPAAGDLTADVDGDGSTKTATAPPADQMDDVDGDGQPTRYDNTGDPVRDLLGARTGQVARIAQIRRFGQAELDQLEPHRAQLQSKVGRELIRHAKALVKVETAKDNADRLKKLAGQAAMQNRPGALRRIARHLARLRGEGDQTPPSAKPVTAAELAADADRPDVIDIANCPEDLKAILAHVYGATKLESWPRRTLELIRDLAGTVRESREAIPRAEDPEHVVLAYQLEAGRSTKRPTVLDQLEARIKALGGELPAQSSADISADIEEPVRDRLQEAKALLDADAEGSDFGGRPLSEDGPPAVEEPPPGGDSPAAPPAAKQSPEPRAAQDLPAWDLSALPVPIQITRSTTARALELAAALSPLEAVAQALVAEAKRKNRAPVLEALGSRRQELEAIAAPAPSSVARPPAQAAGDYTRVKVEDLDVVQLPDGRQELWVRPAGEQPRRLGDVREPRLASAVQLYANHQAQLRAAQAPPAHIPTAAAATATPTQLQAAQAALSALAAGLPALAAMGLHVDLRITTRTPGE